jgi:hypothetical protein
VLSAQVFTAIQFVVEEKFLGKYNVPPLQAVGMEGVFGLLILAILWPILYVRSRAVRLRNATHTHTHTLIREVVRVCVCGWVYVHDVCMHLSLSLSLSFSLCVFAVNEGGAGVDDGRTVR